MLKVLELSKLDVNTKSDTEQRIESFFAKIGMQVRKVAGDGNCALHAAMYTKKKLSRSDIKVYRDSVAANMWKNKETFAGFFTGEEYKKECDNIKNGKTAAGYFGDAALRALAEVLHVNLIVWKYHPDTGQFYCSEYNVGAPEDVFIVYDGIDHFNALVHA